MFRSFPVIPTLAAILFATSATGQTLTPPAQDYALHFGGISVAYTDQINLGASFTMETWLFLDAASSSALIMGKPNNPRSSDPSNHYILGLSGTGLRPIFVQSTGQAGSSRTITAPTDVPLRTWTHVAATLSGGVMRLYVNGQQVSSGTSPGTPAVTSVPFSLGQGVQDGIALCCLQLNGALREARVWSRALSSAELITFSSHKLTGSETGLLANWPFNQTSGTTANSIGPQAAPLTLRNIIWSPVRIMEGGPYFETTVLPSFTGVPGTPGFPGGMHTVPYKNAQGLPDVLIAYSQYPNTQPYTGDESISAPILFLKNNGNRSFTAVRPAQPATTVFARNSAVADFDGDGFEDVVIADHGFDATPTVGSIPRIMMQRAGTMQDETASRLPTVRSFTHDICAADVNRDGAPDIFEANLSTPDSIKGPRLYLNDGHGHFQNAQQNLPASFNPVSGDPGFAGCAFADVNRDGAPDLLLGGYPGTRDWLLLNDGTGKFTDVSAASMPLKLGSLTATSYSFAAGDFNRDGWVDFIVSIQEGPFSARMQLLINNGDGTFRNQDDAALNVHIDKWFDKGYVADFNHDGWPDFFVQENALGGRLYQNMGGWFEDRTDTLPWTNGGIGFRIADFDGDGMIDVLTTGATNTIAWGKKLWPAVCSGNVSLTGWAFSAQGGTGSVDITTPANCPWSVTNLPSWVQLTSAASGTGNGTITFQVSANPGAAASGTVSVAGVPFIIQQEAGNVPGLNAIGSLAQMVSGGSWETLVNYVNLGSTPATVRTNIFGDAGNELALPLDFPLTGYPDVWMASSLDRTLNPGASLLMHSAGSDTQPTNAGWANVFATGNVSAFAIFTNSLFHWNAVVPLETRNAAAYVLPFDNTTGVVTGLAIANLSAQSANVPIVIRDDQGTQIDTRTISLIARGHDSFMLGDRYTTVVGKRGTVEFDTPPGGQISVLGLRAPNFQAVTTVPVLANVSSGGGSMAHVAFNSGWDTTFTVVNTGAVAGSFTLNFYDNSGVPLVIPLRTLSTGATQSTSSVTATLPAGASLIMQTQGDAAALITLEGSAVLSTTAAISANAIFRWNAHQQEATVPLETRSPGSYVMAFDNTSGLVAGLAVAEVSGIPANVMVQIRDDGGNLLDSKPIALAGHGHKSFLVSDQFPLSAGRRGTVEFITPVGSKLSVLGLRAKNDGTLTTIPALAK